MALSDLTISKFIVCTQTFIDNSNVQEDAKKYAGMTGVGEEFLQKSILDSRESPAFSTLISRKGEMEKIGENKLDIVTGTEIRLSCLNIVIHAQLKPIKELTIGQSITLIEETKKIVKQKIQNWKKDDQFEFAVLIEISPELFSKLDPKQLEAELPILSNCGGSNFTYSLSYSKLGELDEPTDLAVMTFREAGLLRESWIIAPPPMKMQVSINRLRWWKIALLTVYALQCAKRKYDELLSEIVGLEKEVENATKNFPDLQEPAASMLFFNNLTGFRKKFIEIRYRIARLHEISECVDENIQLVKWGVRIIPSSGGPGEIDERVVACTDKVLLIPGFLIMEASGSMWSDIPETVEEMVNSPEMHFLSKLPALDIGLVGQMDKTIDLVRAEVDEEETRAATLVKRLNGHINDVTKVVEAQTALTLQKTQTILAQNTVRVDRNFGILTLIFAVFSIGQVVSAFSIWYWGESTQTSTLPLTNLLWAVGITVSIMIIALLIALIFYLHSFKTKSHFEEKIK